MISRSLSHLRPLFSSLPPSSLSFSVLRYSRGFHSSFSVCSTSAPGSSSSTTDSSSKSDPNSTSGSQKDSSDDGSSSSHDSDSSSGPSQSPPQSRRFVPWLIAFGVTTGLVVAYDRGVVGDLATWHFFNQLDSKGLSVFLPFEGVDFSLADLCGVTGAFRQRIITNESQQKLINGLTDPDVSDDIKNRILLVYLSLLMNPMGATAGPSDEEIRHKLANQSGLIRALFLLAMRSQSSAETVSICFANAKFLLSHEFSPPVQPSAPLALDSPDQPIARLEFFASSLPLLFLSRAARSSFPDVQSSALECFASLLPHLPDWRSLRSHYRFTQTDAESLWQAFTNLGASMSENHQPHTAVSAWRYSVQIQPSNGGVLAALGQECAKLGLLDEAIQHLKKAATIEPLNLLTQYTLYSTMAKMGPLDESARSQLIASLRPALKAFQSRLNAALNFSAAGQSAEDGLIIASLPNIYKLLVDSLRSLSRLDEAEEVCGEWVERAPLDAQARFQFGRILLAARKFDSAVEQFQAAKLRDPNKPETLYSIAVCQYKSGALEDALHTLEQSEKVAKRAELEELEDSRRRLIAQVAALKQAQDASGAESTPIQMPPPIEAAEVLNSPVCTRLPAIHFLEGKILQRQGRFADALIQFQLYRTLRQRDNLHLDAMVREAQCLYKVERKPEAHRLFTSVLLAWQQEIKARRENKAKYFKSRPGHAAALQQIEDLCKSAANLSAADELRNMCQQKDAINKL